MDGGAWWATVHGVAKSQTRLNDFTFTFTFSYLVGQMHGINLDFPLVSQAYGEGIVLQD